MKRLSIIMASLILFACLKAETTPLNAYFENPSAAAFMTAFDFCSNKLAQHPTQLTYKILMANLATMESVRLADEIHPMLDSLQTGAKFQYANLLLAQNRFDEAVAIYDVLNKNTPNWSCPWRHKGEALFELKRYEEAEVSLIQAIETNKEHYDAYVWMAKTQYQLGKYKEALKHLETALTLDPEAEASEDAGISKESVQILHRDLRQLTGKSR